MVKNENDFLGILISNADNNHDCNVMDAIRKSGISDIDCLPFIKSLETKGFIKTMDFETIHIYPQAFESYTIPKRKIKNSILKTSKFTLKTVLEIIIGIIIAILSGFILYHLGWN